MITVYHTSEHRGTEYIIYAVGEDQWLGDGYYFWQDFEFAREWGAIKKYTSFDIYAIEVNLNFDTDEDVIDTVFNEIDYYKFVDKIEYFARLYFEKFNDRPTLQEFNNFIQDYEIWKGVKAMRFQDLPANNKKDFLKVTGFYYKKRIQIVLFDMSLLIKSTITHTL